MSISSAFFVSLRSRQIAPPTANPWTTLPIPCSSLSCALLIKQQQIRKMWLAKKKHHVFSSYEKWISLGFRGKRFDLIEFSLFMRPSTFPVFRGTVVTKKNGHVLWCISLEVLSSGCGTNNRQGRAPGVLWIRGLNSSMDKPPQCAWFACYRPATAEATNPPLSSRKHFPCDVNKTFVGVPKSAPTVHVNHRPTSTKSIISWHWNSHQQNEHFQRTLDKAQHGTIRQHKQSRPVLFNLFLEGIGSHKL